MRLQDIIDRSNRGVIRCADGFRMSVISGYYGTYCNPRPGFNQLLNYSGPFTEVEVGFPSARPEPWDTWREYCENVDEPTETVYAYVPVDVVRALVESHGGAA